MSWNEILYGGFLNGGYTQINSSITSVASAGATLTKNVSQGQFSFIPEPLKEIKNTIFYFGLNYGQAWQNCKSYFLRMFPLFFLAGRFGLDFIFFPRLEVEEKILGVFAGVFCRRRDFAFVLWQLGF